MERPLPSTEFTSRAFIDLLGKLGVNLPTRAPLNCERKRAPLFCSSSKKETLFFSSAVNHFKKVFAINPVFVSLLTVFFAIKHYPKRLVNGVDPNYLLTGMILQVPRICPVRGVKFAKIPCYQWLVRLPGQPALATSNPPVNSGQIIIFHPPRFPWNKGTSLAKPPFGVRSCEVAIIWPELIYK